MGLLNTIATGYDIYSKEKDRRDRKEEREEDLEEKRETQREEREYKKNKALLENVLNLEFDTTNKDGIIKDLTTLLSYIDLWSDNYDCLEHYDAAKSKFETGLAFLCALNPTHPMAIYFLQKKTEWIAKKKKARKRKRNIIIGVIVGIILFFAFLFMMTVLEKKGIV